MRVGDVGDTAARYALIERAVELEQYAFALMLAKGGSAGAADILEGKQTSERLRRMAKAAVGAGGLGNPGWAQEIGAQSLVSAFLENLASISVYDQLLAGGMVRSPLRTKVSSVTAAAAGHIGTEGAAQIISRMTLGNNTQIDPIRAYCIIVATEELVRFAVAGTSTFLARELRSGVAAVTNERFLGDLFSAAAPTVSAGTDIPAVREDIRTLLTAISPRANSRIYVVMRPQTATDLSLMSDADGELAFPNLSFRGGELQRDLPVLVSDQLGVGRVIMVDATGLAGESGEVTFNGSRQTALQLSDTPTNDSLTPTPTTATTLFQTNSVALKAERYFGYEVVRSSAVAALEEVDWGTANGSDA
jgi:HK97 family phage major capsid protein